MFDETEIEEKNRTSNNYWFYSTIVLVGLIGVGAIAYIAYHFGQKSTVDADRIAVSSNVSNSQPSKPADYSNSLNVNTSTNRMNMSPAATESGATTINGEIFVVTKGRQNIKLALVEVCALSEPTILSWIKQKQQRGKKETEAANTRLITLKGELRSIEKDFDASKSGGSYSESRFTLERAKIDKNSEIGLAEIRQYYWISPEYYLDGIRGCEASTKSDSEGHFKLDLPSGKRYAIAAQTSRRILDSSETYWWLLWVDPNKPNQTIALNNDNLMAENPSNRVIPITRFIPSSY